jgi:hypothetical protein
MTTCRLTREGFSESIVQNGTEVVIYVVEVYSIAELNQSSAALTDEEIKAQGRAVTDGDPLPEPTDTRSGITSPRFRVYRNLQARQQAKVRVTWGARYLSGGGAISVQQQRSYSRDELVLQPFLRSKIAQFGGQPASVIVLDQRKVDRLITQTVIRRLLPNEISVAQADAIVEANRRKYYTFNGVTKILERHEIIPANQTQLYIDTWFYSKSAMPGVAIRSQGDTTLFAVDPLPVLGEYVEPIPNEDTRTSVQNFGDIYEPGASLPWLL